MRKPLSHMGCSLYHTWLQADQRDAAAARVDDLALCGPELSDDKLDESRLAVAYM